MEGAVGDFCAQELDLTAHTALANSIFGFDNQCARAHAHQHAVAATIERQGRTLDDVLRRGSARGHKPRTHPFHQVVRSEVVSADHDHAPAASQANPVLGDRNSRRGRRASRVDLCVGSANTKHFGELGVAHRQRMKDKTPIELKFGLLLARFIETRDFVGEVVEAREGRGEDHAGLVGHGQWQTPAVRQVAASGGASVVAHKRNTSVAQGLDASGNGERRRDIEGLATLLGHTEFLGQIEGALAPSQTDNLVGRLDGLQAWLADLALV